MTGGAPRTSLEAALRKLTGTDAGQIALAVILGLGLAGIFRSTCGGQEGRCVVVTAPPVEEVHGKTFRLGEKCFRYRAEATECGAR